jgi:hypothetical protein
MNTAFLSIDNASLKENRPTGSPLADAIAPPHPEQEQLQIILISNPHWVTETIHELHRLNFTEVRAWSRLLPTAHPGQVISILTRRRS